jgi:hypothetical protein
VALYWECCRIRFGLVVRFVLVRLRCVLAHVTMGLLRRLANSGSTHERKTHSCTSEGEQSVKKVIAGC